MTTPTPPVDNPTPEPGSSPSNSRRTKAIDRRNETPFQRQARLHAERRRRIAEARGE